MPPKTLFPESKDAGGRDYRRNLITVPSCDRHNSAKSRDDEFLLLSLAGILGNNSIGYRQRFSKVERAIGGRAERLVSLIMVGVHRVQSDLTSNRFLEVIWGTPDVTRLTRCFEHIAYGLHHHHFGTSFSGKLFVHLGYLNFATHNSKAWNAFIRDRAAVDLDGKALFGSNPDVFTYQVTDPDTFGFFLFRLVFYGGIEVLIAFQPNGVAEAAHIGTALIGAGVRTVLSAGERTYEFNPDA